MTRSAPAVSTPAIAGHAAKSVLLLGALGVVFGDIGTSPIYGFRESLKAAGGTPAEPTVLGVLSLVFWAVVLVVALKYVVFVMRADNQGEGGTMALLSLAIPVAGRLQGPLLVAGHLRAERDRGTGNRNSGVQTLRRSHCGRRSARPFRHPKSRQRQDGRAVRTGDGGVVRH